MTAQDAWAVHARRNRTRKEDRMSNDLSAYAGTTLLDVERIGTNGSISGWFALLLAGYAVGDFLESERVRARWIAELPITPWDAPRMWFPHDDLSIPAHQARTRAAVRQVIEYDQDHQHWFTIAEHTIARGRQRAPIRCPILNALMWLHDLPDADDTCYGRIADDAVGAFARAFDAVLPHLAASGWHAKLQRLRRVILAAEAAAAPALCVN